MASAGGSRSFENELGAQDDINVLDVANENGPRLVETSSRTADLINASPVPIRALPLIEYPRPRLHPYRLQTANVQPAGGGTTTFTVVDAQSGAPVAGAYMVAFTNFASRQGADGTSDAQGKVSLSLRGGTIDRLYLYGPPNHWGAYRAGISVANMNIAIEPVDLSYVDSVRHFYANSRFNAGAGVVVGVLDTGCGPHPDLNVTGGCATVTGEPSHDFSDNDVHGTHVAGLIGASGGLRGVAPGVEIRSYRVFPRGGGATNYAILKAMFAAAADGCDIVNLSLGGGPYDEVVAEAIQDARNQGMLVVVAAGNDERQAVSFPAAHQGAIAVSAMGCEGTFPQGSVEEGDIQRPPASQVDPAEFIAAFSNIGPQICLTAPGVGTLSTLPQGAYGPMSGTSMAAPVAAGAAASLLSQDPAVLAMQRNRSRSDALYNLVVQNCVRRRFGQQFEGFGLPDPGVV